MEALEPWLKFCKNSVLGFESKFVLSLSARKVEQLLDSINVN